MWEPNPPRTKLIELLNEITMLIRMVISIMMHNDNAIMIYANLSDNHSLGAGAHQNNLNVYRTNDYN